MWGFKPKSYLGIDFGAGGIKLVELRKEKNRPVLFTYAFTSTPQDVHQFASRSILPKESNLASSSKSSLVEDNERINYYSSLIQSVCKEARTTSKVAVVSVPVSAVFHTIVTLPLVKKDEFDRLLKAEIQKLLPYKLEDTALDYEIISEKSESRTQRVLVNAVPRELVLFYSKIFQKAGLKLDSIEPESVALSRSLVGRDAALTMVVDMGAERTNFFIVEGTKTITHHSIETGGLKINRIIEAVLKVEASSVEQIKQDLFGKLLISPQNSLLTKDIFLDIFTPVLDPIVKEVEYSFELYLRQSESEQRKPEKIILTGGAALFPYLATYLNERFKIKCYIGDPWGRVVYQESLRALLHAIGPRMSVAVGLALRNIVN